MVYHLSSLLKSYISCAHSFHYISFRALAALITVLALSMIAGGAFIARAQQLFASKSRQYTPEGHRAKDNMPTMGGVFIVGVVCITTLIWANTTDPRVWILLATLLLFGLIGFWDDWSKIARGAGVPAVYKARAQIAAAVFLISWWVRVAQPELMLIMPIWKHSTIPLGPLIYLWWVWVLVGASNAVNLTDGLDGLAIGSLIPNFATFAVIGYLAGHYRFAEYLHIPYMATAEVGIVGAILVGASMGFFWFNAYPAQIFMGDVGSLSLGAALAMMAIMTRQELLLAVSGILFVIETVSVMTQVVSFRYFGRRIFRMAPIHHHFEILGWPESKITIRFALISCIACLVALMMLKVR